MGTSRHQQSNYGMTGFPGNHGQQSLVQQQLMRNQVPPQMQANPYAKPEQMKSATVTSGQQLGGLQNRPYTAVAAAAAASNSNAVQQQQAVKNAVTSLASMSLRSTVLGTGAPSTNGTAGTVVAATSGTPAVQQTTSYSPTPIQRPPGGKGQYFAKLLNLTCIKSSGGKIP